MTDLTLYQTRCAQRAQTPPRLLQCRPLVSDNISYKMPHLLMLRKVKKTDPRSRSGSTVTPKFNYSRRFPLPMPTTTTVCLQKKTNANYFLT